MRQTLKYLFFPEHTLAIDIRKKWFEEDRDTFLKSISYFFIITSTFSVLHLFAVDLSSGFKPTWLFVFVRLMNPLLMMSTLFLTGYWKSSRFYKIPYVITLSFLCLSQIWLMYNERSIPFFIALIFFIIPPIAMSLSLGFTFLITNLLFLGSLPWLTSLLNKIDVPMTQQILSNYMLIMGFACGFQALNYKKNLELFNLKEKNIRLNDELARKEKIATAGVLSAGIGHEIGNSLNHMMGTSAYLTKISKSREIDWEKLETAKNLLNRALERAINIINNLNTAVLSQEDMGLNSLKEIVDGAILLVNNAAKKSAINIKIESINDIVVKCNKPSILQVFLNLLLNAIYELETKKIHDPLILIRWENKNGIIEINVEDNGNGIAEKDRDRVFDPFFTTKPIGKGTGLGLHLVRNELIKNNASIEITNSTIGGAKFVIKFR